MIQRGGQVLSTGEIGLVKCLRQQKMLPGETIQGNILGDVKMEALRERNALRLNAHIGVFATPIRWLDSNWVSYVKAGPTSNTYSLSFDSNIPGDFIGLGGNVFRRIQRYWRRAFERVYNEWYKWPEDSDVVLTSFSDNTRFTRFPAVNLEHSWTRCRSDVDTDHVADRVAPATSSLDVRDLAEAQSRFRAAMEMDVLSYNRYMELLQERFGSSGSREADQVPILVFQDELGVAPRSFSASDAAGLGQWASFYDFEVNAPFEFTAPEHCILTYALTIRFAPISEEVHPLANDRLTWAEEVGDPGLLAALRPQDVQLRDLLDTTSSTSLGYLPAGWQWRCQNNQIGYRVNIRDSFPYMEQPTTQAQARDSSLTKPAFRSASLQDYVVDVYCSEKSMSPIPGAESSYYSGMDGGKSSDNPYPHLGKVK